MSHEIAGLARMSANKALVLTAPDSPDFIWKKSFPVFGFLITSKFPEIEHFSKVMINVGGGLMPRKFA